VPTEPEIIVPETSPEKPDESINLGTPTPEVAPAESVEATVPDRVPTEPEIIVPEVSREESGGLITNPDTTTSEEMLTGSGTQSASPEPLIVVPQISGEEGTGQSDAGIPESGQSEEPVIQPEEESTSPAPGSPPPPGVMGKPQKSSIIAAAIIVLILGIAAIALFSPSSFGAPARELFPGPTPSLTATPESIPSIPIPPAPTPVLIPSTGVWVRVTYPHDYFGRLGNPGSLREVSGSGDRFYQMNADNPLVQVQMSKTDNSGDILSVDIYRNGKLMTHRTTSSPMGDIDLLIDATTGAPPGIPPRITQNTGPVPANNQTHPVPSPTVTHAVNTTTQITNQTNNQSGSQVMYF
jgi:hypothetical protein